MNIETYQAEAEQLKHMLAKIEQTDSTSQEVFAVRQPRKPTNNKQDTPTLKSGKKQNTITEVSPPAQLTLNTRRKLYSEESRRRDRERSKIIEHTKYDENISKPPLHKQHEKTLAQEVYEGDMTVGTYCRHLEHLLQENDDIPDDQTDEYNDIPTLYDSDTESEDDTILQETLKIRNTPIITNKQDQTNTEEETDNYPRTLSLDPIRNRKEIELILRDDEIQENMKRYILEAAEAQPAEDLIIGPEAILWMNEFMHIPGRLSELQKEEREDINRDPSRAIELEEDLKTLESEYELLGEQEELRPEEFPKELWKYVRMDQKPLIKARFELYENIDTLKNLIEDIKTKTKC
jgi:hypothetical protein